MKKRIRIFCILLCALFLCALYPLPTLAASDTVEVAVITNVKNNVNVRAKASVLSALLGTANKDTKYTVLGSEGDFIKILYNGTTAYIHKDYVELRSYPRTLTDDVSLRVATFNVKAMSNGTKLQQVVQAIREAGAEIVGLQEVDRFASRSGKLDYAQELADAAGYPYYYFSKAISLGGGEYGTLILSKQPIIHAETFKLTSTGENRVMGYVQLLTGKGLVHFFNVHMPNGTSKQKAATLRTMESKIKSTGASTYIVTGDFNANADWLEKNLEMDLCLANTELTTFGKGSSAKIIDNILYSGNIKPGNVGKVDTLENNVSDHNLISLRVKIPKG